MCLSHIVQKRAECGLPADHPVLLWLDGHGSRATPDVCRALQAAHVTCVVIPGHTSHILQPLDCGVNAAFKNALGKKRQKISTDDVAETRRRLLNCAHEALHEALYSRTISTAWRVCGLFPWDPAKVLDDKEKVTPTPETTPTSEQKASGSGCNVSGMIL
eukprot:c11808_g1_i1.p1 GENE.c11808_g1_i1~~c11808_g1_i1.p1  ORF type:complete len:160 (+),score=22.33 c11808_g1_i1:811-1290(+)